MKKATMALLAVASLAFSDEFPYIKPMSVTIFNPDKTTKTIEFKQGIAVEPVATVTVQSKFNGEIASKKDGCINTDKKFIVDGSGCPKSAVLDVIFQQASSTIVGDRSSESLEWFAKFLRENSYYKAQINGHADGVGSKEKNLKLSQKRAESTKEALVLLGIDSSRLTAVGKGMTEPIASNNSETGRFLNRRIEAVLIR